MNRRIRYGAPAIVTLVLVGGMSLANPVGAEGVIQQVCRNPGPLQPVCDAVEETCQAVGGYVGFYNRKPYLGGPEPYQYGKGDADNAYGSFYYMGNFSWPGNTERNLETYWFSGQVSYDTDDNPDTDDHDFCDEATRLPPAIHYDEAEHRIY